MRSSSPLRSFDPLLSRCFYFMCFLKFGWSFVISSCPLTGHCKLTKIMNVNSTQLWFETIWVVEAVHNARRTCEEQRHKKAAKSVQWAYKIALKLTIMHLTDLSIDTQSLFVEMECACVVHWHPTVRGTVLPMYIFKFATLATAIDSRLPFF